MIITVKFLHLDLKFLIGSHCCPFLKITIHFSLFFSISIIILCIFLFKSISNFFQVHTFDELYAMEANREMYRHQLLKGRLNNSSLYLGPRSKFFFVKLILRKKMSFISILSKTFNGYW